MQMSQSIADFIAFMEEYVLFVEHMIDDESEKLAAIQEGKLARIEHSIVVSLANAKKLDNFEQRRIALMDKAGFGGMTFSGVINAAPVESVGPLQVLFSRFEKGVVEIKFRNDKAMAVAQDNLISLDPQAVLPQGAGGHRPHNEYERLREEAANQSNILEKKA